MLTITQLTFGEYHNAVTCKVDALDMETQEPAEEVIEYPHIAHVAWAMGNGANNIIITSNEGAHTREQDFKKFCVGADVPMGDKLKLMQEICDHMKEQGL